MLWPVDRFLWLLNPVWVLVFPGFVDLSGLACVVNNSEIRGQIPAPESS